MAKWDVPAVGHVSHLVARLQGLPLVVDVPSNINRVGELWLSMPVAVARPFLTTMWHSTAA